MGRKLSNWLNTYLTEYTDKNETPELFHLWSGLAVLSTITRRKVWLPRGHYNIYPNLYILIIAGSATCRKNTAVNMALNLLKPFERTGQINVARNDITYERLMRFLSDLCSNCFEIPDSSTKLVRGSQALATCTEMTTFLDRDSYKNGFMIALTDLFDSPDRWDKLTKNRGDDYLEDVFLTILGATTPTELGEVLPRQAIGSGFTSRVIFVFQRKPRSPKIPRPEIYWTPEKKAKMEDLITDLAHIYEIRGTFEFSQQAQEFFDAWYSSLPEPEDEKMEGYLGRKHDIMLRVAMLVNLSITDELVLRKSSLEAAIHLLDSVEKYMSGVLAVLAGDDQYHSDVHWIIKKIVKEGGIACHSDLLRMGWNRFKADTFNTIINSMLENKLLGWKPGRKQRKEYFLVDSPEMRSIVEMIYGGIDRVTFKSTLDDLLDGKLPE